MTAVPMEDSADPAREHGRTTVPPGPGAQPALTRRIDRTIVLVGLMGAGKSCIGKRLAGYLRLPFTDADKEIEAAAGCSISDYFAQHGEKAFRDGERRVIQRLLSGPVQVLATGGGAFMDPTTRALIREHALSIWLRADLDLLVRRVARRNERPLLQNVDPRQKLSELMEIRYPVYGEADLVVDSMDGPPEATLSRVVAALEQAVATESGTGKPAQQAAAR
ncbi:MAG TPA: shikimate kinase [Dongiaceae bacterium]|nr:shikimate kinase [Dongiaceae bacterium]